MVYLWEERGWKITAEKDHSTTYSGMYRAQDARGRKRSFRGYIEVSRPYVFNFKLEDSSLVIGEAHEISSPELRVLIVSPPREIKDHPHGSCFAFRGIIERNKRPLFALNFEKPPRDIDSVIVYMENMLWEAMNHNYSGI